MSEERLFSHPVSRVIAATIGVLLTAVLVTTAMPSYLPLEQANSVVMPIILFPVTWLLLLLWVLFEQKLWRAWVGLVLLSALHLGLILSGVGIV
ncbi:MAG: DUF3649 domain-containing protein [Pseudomonadota bacterium]